jgi:hypothetical protein
MFQINFEDLNKFIKKICTNELNITYEINNYIKNKHTTKIKSIAREF